ncbi:cysteine desulfurase NifS [Roseibium marinum]|uniref:Cysteine desulfurase n=1 Tax=Roseibium marinum TaxID=281252 RepID=A0A2S3V1K8_9HYPH|nr:cysteine desulfurase NifS [Roseibium marinum]POF33852.1 cysteine desulfurase [Roseibium marinum]
MRAIYLDNNATTRTDPEVVAAMLPFFTEQFGNASSTHTFGSEVAGAVREARRHVQNLLGAAHDHEVIFTSGGTESDNAALLSALENQPERNQIVTMAVEHPAVLSLVAYLRQSRGIEVTTVGVNENGELDIEAYRAALGPRTAVASVMWANNETGTIYPVELLAGYAHEAGALFHTDAVQAVGKIPIDLSSSAIDMLSLSGHKLHAPKGIGALYVRKGVKFKPLLRGGRQERGRRAGTENIPAIVGLGKAAEIAAVRIEEEQTKVRALRDRLEQGVLQQIGNCSVVGGNAERLPNTSNIAFDCLDSEAILHKLEQVGIAASSGSACASGSMEPSHVLRAMNVPATALQGAIRFSLSRDNTPEDIGRVLDVMPGIISKLQSMSPLWRDRHETKAATSGDGEYVFARS